jgi:general secretion pathway protein G
MTRRGFTLIEMLVTVALVSILATLVVPFTQVAAQRAKEAELRHALRLIRGAIDAYKRAGDEQRIYRSATTTGYPQTLNDLVDGKPELRATDGRKIYFLRRLPRDPMNDSRSTPPEATWGKRSYASEADDPKEGDDVYDVYSLSPKTGLNGEPYRKW